MRLGMKWEPTFWARVYVGFKYRNEEPLNNTQKKQRMREAEHLCQQYCDEVGLCVTIEPTDYIYTNGREPGCVVGLINYPRFPCHHELIQHHATEIAKRLQTKFRQCVVSVVFPEQTLMITDENMVAQTNAEREAQKDEG